MTRSTLPTHGRPAPASAPSPASARRRVRLALALPAAVALVVLPAAVASAHVTVNPDTTAAGGRASLTFRVPTESDTASTSQVVVDLPTAEPFLSVSAKAVPGWDVTVERGALPEPVDVDGTTLTEAPFRVVWTARPGSEIPPHQYQELAIRVGMLPGEGTDVVLPAHQTYTDGSVVDWADVPVDGEEPELPAPSFTTTAAEGEDLAAATPEVSVAPEAAAPPSGTDPLGRVLGGTGLALGAGALGVALRSRRRAS